MKRLHTRESTCKRSIDDDRSVQPSHWWLGAPLIKGGGKIKRDQCDDGFDRFDKEEIREEKRKREGCTRQKQNNFDDTINSNKANEHVQTKGEG